MGSSCSSCFKKKHHKKLKSDSTNGSSELDETLNFKVEISNIKARNLPATSSYIRIKFGSQRVVETPEITTNSLNYSWKFSQEFDYRTTRASLKEESIMLILMDKVGKEIGFVSINLYDIATGPSHQDLMIRMKQRRLDPGRLSFDVKMSQIINIVIQAKLINCKMLASLREKLYNFSIKMSAKDREISDHSENFKNTQMVTAFADKNVEDVGHVEDLDENYQLHMDENKKLKTKYFTGGYTHKNYKRMRLDLPDQREPETSEISKPEEESILRMAKNKISSFTKTKTMNTLTHVAAAKRDVIWTYPENSPKAPSIDMDVNVRELASASFQFFLWASKEGADRSISEDEECDYSGDEQFTEYKLLAECFIAMNLFFAGDAEIHAGEVGSREIQGNTPRSYQKRIIQIHEKLVYHGDYEGDLTAEFIVQNSLFHKQMIFGVRTEEGIQKSSSLYLNADKTLTTSLKNMNVKEIKLLSQHKDILKNVTFSLYGPKVNPRTKIKLTDELATNIMKVVDILKTSHQESAISVLYKTPENLLASQKVLIGLAKHALENCDEVLNSLRPFYFEILLLLINRAEFELSYMGFDESYEEFLKNAQKASFKNDITGPKIDLKNIQQKLKVCESYQSFLYHALQKVLTKLNQGGLPEREREFVEQFTAIAYFRIPEFRKKLLDCLKRDIEHIPLEEWRSEERRYSDRIEINEKNKHFVSLFDWQGDFYVYLKNTEKGESNYKLLNEILEDKDWQHRLSKRGVAFHSFLNEWAKHVNKTVVTKDHVPWQDLPGYSILIKSFLVELKTKDVRRYPQLLLNTSYSLLKNEKLLDCFVAVIYNKTRIYESSNVFAVYELINNWFGVLKESKKSISPTFDYAYFFKGITMVIEGDHALTISKAIWVIYNNFNQFPYTQKERLSEYFFGDIFFKLFLHWSWNVRQVFHHLLIYRFYHQHRNTTTNLTNLDDLRKELLLYNQRRENFSKTKKVLINDFINMEYSRHMTIIENAYKKYREGKSQRTMRAKPQPQPQLINTTKQTRDTLRTSDLPETSESKQSLTLNSERKEEEFPKLKLKGFGSERQEVDSVVDDIFEMPEKLTRKQSTPQIGEPSYWFIDSDDVELSMQGPATRNSRRGSLNITPPNKMLNKPEDLNMLEIEAAKRTLDVIDEIDTLRVSPADTRKSMQGFGDEERKRDRKKVIVRRLMYFDKQTNKLKEIPKEYAVYLEYAYKEYEIIKEQYVKWSNELLQKLLKLPEEQAKKEKADPKVPELNVRIPLDEGEDGQMELDDW